MRLTDVQIKFCMAYLGLRDTLLTAAVASKGMMELSTADLLWDLHHGLHDSDFKSGVAIELGRSARLDCALEYGITFPPAANIGYC